MVDAKLTRFTDDINEIQVLDRSTAREALTGVLHAILFHRLFGTIKPSTIEVLDVTMV